MTKNILLDGVSQQLFLHKIAFLAKMGILFLMVREELNRAIGHRQEIHVALDSYPAPDPIVPEGLEGLLLVKDYLNRPAVLVEAIV